MQKLHRIHLIDGDRDWVKVAITELEEMGIADQISNKSYVDEKRRMAYLDKEDYAVYRDSLTELDYKIGLIDTKIDSRTFFHDLERYGEKKQRGDVGYDRSVERVMDDNSESVERWVRDVDAGAFELPGVHALVYDASSDCIYNRYAMSVDGLKLGDGEHVLEIFSDPLVEERKERGNGFREEYKERIRERLGEVMNLERERKGERSESRVIDEKRSFSR